MSYLFAPAAQPTLPISGSARLFPVRRIYCVGRNYAAHAVEMGGDPSREPPFFFQKNPNNILGEGQPFPYPPRSHDVHFEVELVVALQSGGTDIAVERALEHVFGYAVGLDMTRRDLQDEAKAARRPWETAKAFEHSAPCSALVPVADDGHPATGAITLDVDGSRRQTGDLAQMIWKVPETIAYLSGLFELAAGDLIFTGTPSGVGPVRRGETMLARIEGVGELSVAVV